MDFSVLNDRQAEAVRCTEGPLLIIAGAGSGKTRVLTYRIAYLMQDCGVDPWNIMAITFTNKAASEMRERVNRIAGHGAESVWVSTFHSACARILRRYIDRIGYGTDFSIYDTDDSKTVMKAVLAEMNVDSKRFTVRGALSVISAAKNKMLSVEDMEAEAASRDDDVYAAAYRAYEERLRKNNALDFDDLLVKTVELFEKEPQVLEMYRDRLKYIMVDEYQDTNGVQFKFVSLLAEKHKNLCVVGDDDQSIYKFRGADISNILDFEKVFPKAKVIKLEQNYRSTGAILDVANEVIKNNRERREKVLWTAAEEGRKVVFCQYETGREEAAGVASDIKRAVLNGANYSDFAILYRTNAQSRALEEQLIAKSVPYKIIGGVNFYARKEIKDILAYLKTIANGRDDLAVKRIINVPKRGIGKTSIDRVTDFAARRGSPFFEALVYAENIPDIGSALKKIRLFTGLILRFRTIAPTMPVTELIQTVCQDSGYTAELEADGTDESIDRLENLNELVSKAALYEKEAENPTLSGFLEEVALVADIDELSEDRDSLVLMTIHSAKGLEFEHVYITGMEDGLFPGFRTIYDVDPSALEEERRLAYVGFTRAKKTLTLTGAKLRMMMGETEGHAVSRFVKEIPDYLLDIKGGAVAARKKEEPRHASGGFGSLGYVNGASGKGKYAGSQSLGKMPAGFTPKQFKVERETSLSYGVGDRVLHRKFGEGTVAEIVNGSKDFEVTVDFDTAGRKRMFASFAKLEKL
ncbi:MAG: UvrD-helicase domain-containing protein [Eubacterium sp.]|nr:UvrD-helicase domain-containing protein [Eubacterium sp.]